MPEAISSSTCWHTIMRMREVSYSPSISRNASGLLFSQPSPTIRTAPAFGCRTMFLNILRVFSWSSPNCEQP